MHIAHFSRYNMRYVHHNRNPFVAITTVAELVRAARNGRSQKEFARELGIRQSSVSRYESGRANPPVKVIEHCMRLVHSTGTESAPTADELAAKIRTELADSDLSEVRLALARLIDTLASEHTQARAMSQSSS
ncbi:putative zinc finger/helix-turn-helix protein, YgiT family [Methylococcus capsulatus]|jgi:transcriptional regulator with XRE-family HTH domain|uniref:Zinc finger/helix-turn-helix protein, YgiT family n=1 Tax=Methylococcus capsulatus TaxID=414 RepID=A0AA35UDY3_METCP|nr:helix-turn-helix domain-containing protein [Methylococcus capsulatus]CAI8818126.1 putative zinc finger/helix-turn-helix protein, YgiT family [Methylococcus capsulatus]